MPETGSEQGTKVKSTREKLVEVEAAIHELMTGKIKSYMIGRRMVTYLNLEDLRRYQRELTAQLRAEGSDGTQIYGSTVSFFDRR